MDATAGLAEVQVVRNLSEERAYFHGESYDNIVILYVLSGYGDVRIGETGRYQLSGGDCCSLPGHTAFQVIGKKDFCMLMVFIDEKE